MWGFGSFHVRRRGSPRAQNEDAPPGCFLMIAVPVLFVISSYFAWEELWYALLGRTTTASVERVIDSRAQHTSRRGRAVYHVSYTFIDPEAGEPWVGNDEIPRTWNRPEDTIDVEYISGSPDWSRIAGTHNYLSLLFFFVCVIVAAVYGYTLIREARQAVRESEWHEALRRDNS